MLVRIRDVALAQDQAGPGRSGQSHRVVHEAAKNKQVEFLGRGPDGRHRPIISVGKISRMTWPNETESVFDALWRNAGQLCSVSFYSLSHFIATPLQHGIVCSIGVFFAMPRMYAACFLA